jgi:hypothetical protein
VASVQQSIATPARRLGLVDLRRRRLHLSWSALAVAALIAIAAVAQLRFGVLNGPGTNKPAPGASEVAIASRRFYVLPANGVTTSKADAIVADDVLGARVRSLGFGTFTSGGGVGTFFELPLEGPSDSDVRTVLEANGDLEVFLLPQGVVHAVVGQPMPSGDPAVFGWESVDSVTANVIGDLPQISFVLKPDAATTLDGWSRAHVGEVVAVGIDGNVAMLAMLGRANTPGRIDLSPVNNGHLAATGAILVGGRLPDSWRDPLVPILLPLDQILVSVQARNPGATIVSTELDVVQEKTTGDWQVVWNIQEQGEFARSCPRPLGSLPPSFCTYSRQTLVADAITGEVVETDLQ